MFDGEAVCENALHVFEARPQPSGKWLSCLRCTLSNTKTVCMSSIHTQTQIDFMSSKLIHRIKMRCMSSTGPNSNTKCVFDGHTQTQFMSSMLCLKLKNALHVFDALSLKLNFTGHVMGRAWAASAGVPELCLGLCLSCVCHFQTQTGFQTQKSPAAESNPLPGKGHTGESVIFFGLKLMLSQINLVYRKIHITFLVDITNKFGLSISGMPPQLSFVEITSSNPFCTHHLTSTATGYKAASISSDRCTKPSSKPSL